MMNVISIAKCEVFLFNNVNESYSSNSLKQFVYFLRYLGKRGQINFSLSCGSDSLHQDLSIGENFTLDSISKSLIHNSEDHLNKKIHSIENEHTVKLVKMLPEMSTKIENLSLETKALVSIVKSLLSRAEYLFLVDAEMNLSTKTLEIVKSAIEAEATQFGRKILIQSSKEQTWLDLATDIIEKDKNGEYLRLLNPLSSITKNQKTQKPFNFSLVKKVS